MYFHYDGRGFFMIFCAEKFFIYRIQKKYIDFHSEQETCLLGVYVVLRYEMD